MLGIWIGIGIGNGGGGLPVPPNTLRAGLGTFTLTGTAMTPKSAYVVPAQVGTFVETGVAATLTYTPVVTLALDGNVTASSGANVSSLPVTLSTSGANRIIMVLIGGSPSTSVDAVSSVTSANLTFTRRAFANRFNVQMCWAYYAIAASPLTSEVITVNFSTPTGGLTVNALGVSGANTSSPFDPNGALPGIVGVGGAGSAYASVTTTNANTFVYGVMYDSTDYPSVGAQGTGFNLLQNTLGTMSEYKIVSSTQSSLSITAAFVAGNSDCAIGDAITA